jgi:signal transduction histidine kinase
VGTSSGLNLFNPTDETFEHIPLLVESKQNKPTGTEDMMPTQMTILVIRQDEEGLLWIGTVSNGLFRFNPTTREIKHYEFLQGYSNSLTSNLVWAIYPDGPQTIWIGTDRGMTRLDTKYNNFKNYMAENNIRGGLSDYRVLSLFRDNRGILWVGTGSGLNRYDPASDTFKAYHEKDGLPNDYVYAIVQDDENQLWLSTNKGISRFNPEKDNFINYDRKDGLTGDEFNQGSFARDSAGTIYFGGIDGITYFQPDQIRPNTWLPKTMLTSLTQGGLPMSGQRALETLDSIRLTWPKNYFEFTFRNLTSSQANEDQYAYKLIPFEKNWVPALKTGSGRYTNLPGGEYTLYIRGTNNEGVWGQEVPALKVVVIPPFWENRILLAFSLILAAMLVSSGVFLRIRSIEKHNRELSELVTARTREIDQRRQVAEGLREILVRINSNQPIEESLDLITGQGREVVHADLVLILSNCIEKSNAHRVFSQSNGDTDGTELTDQERVWLCEQNALSSGHTLIDPSTYPGMGTPRLKEFASGILFPVVLESRVEAVLAVLTRREAIFSSEEIELLAACADQAALVMGNARLRQKAEDLAMLNERNRLARDLHDAVTQTLFSASLLAEALPSVWENNPQEGRKLTHEMRQLTRGALAEMRSLLMELRPSALAEAKLPDLLRQLTEAVVGRTGLDIHLEVQPDIYLPSEVNITLYRIAQEAMTNIVKHAHAGQVWIRCRKLASETGLQMQVEDDGCGFDLKAVSPDHFGLYNMRERAESVHARLEIASRIGRGTLLTVTWEGEENLNGG